MRGDLDSREQPATPQGKCCPAHVFADNRAERRAADRACRCRGECGFHAPIVAPTVNDARAR